MAVLDALQIRIRYVGGFLSLSLAPGVKLPLDSPAKGELEKCVS